MNKIIIVLLLTTTPLLAQIEKGNSYVWGNVTALNLHNSGYSYSNNTFAPNLNINYGKFTKDGLMIGFSVGWLGAISKTKSTNSGYFHDQDFNIVRFGVFGRKYFKVIPRLNPYAGMGLAMSVSKNIDSQNNGSATPVNTDKKGGWSLLPQFQLGLNYLVSPRISMVLGTTSNVFPISFYGLEMGLNYSLNPQKLNSKVVIIEQTDARNWLLGVGFNTSGYSNNIENSGKKQNVNSGSSTSINLSAGHFVSKGLLLGLAVGVGVNSDKNEVSSGTVVTDKSSAWTVGFRPYIKKYLSRNRLLSPYWQAGVGYEQRISGNYKRTTYSLDGGMGLAYFIGNNLILEAGLANFSYKNYVTPDSDFKYNEVSGGLTFSPNFTLNYVIKSDKK